MGRWILLTAVLLCIGEGTAGLGSQMDWSGTSGIWGPVTTWQNNYYTQAKCIADTTLILSLQRTSQTVQSGIDPYRIDCGDLDGDGFADIAAVFYDAGQICWWRNCDNGTGWSSPSLVTTGFTGARCIQTADMNGDGDNDIVACAFTGDEVCWWENDEGTGDVWTKHQILSSFDGPYSLHVDDLDGDGDMDLLTTSFFGNQLSWWENVDGSALSWEEHTICAETICAFDARCSDVDGDGDLDVIFNDTTGNRILWSENDDGIGTSWTLHSVEESYYEASRVHSGDIDGDGDEDILATTTGYSSEIDWWENLDGLGSSWGGPYNISQTTEFYPTAIFPEDIDLDGDLDLLCSYRSNGAWPLRIYENVDGQGSFECLDISEGLMSFYDVCAMDINGDDYPEVISASQGDQCVLSQDLGLAGALESSLLDTQEYPYWGYFGWQCEATSGTVCFQVRTSDYPDSTLTGAWSERLYEPCELQYIVSPLDRYFQYRAILETTDFDSTPVLTWVGVEWWSSGLEEGQLDPQPLLRVNPNPAVNEVNVVCSVPVHCDLGLRVYDLSGRLAAAIDLEAVEPGEHCEVLEDLRQGLYFIMMHWPGGTERTTFLVLR